MSVVDAFIQLRTDQRALKDDVDAGIRAAGRGTAPRTAGAEAGRNFASNMTGKIESETRRSAPRFIANWAAIGSASGHGFSDKFTSALRPMRDALDRLSHRVVSPKLELAGQRLTRTQLDLINRGLSRIDGRRATAHVAVRTSGLDKLSKLSFLKPSLLGAGIALSPALIPLTAGVAAGVAAIGVSFGAAAIGAGVFGLAAKSVLSTASTNLAKLQALELALGKATTAAQKKSAQAAIAALKATWAPGYLALLDQLDTFKKTWSKVSQTLAVPALSAWLPALTKGMPLLVTAVKPVAAVFQLWGRMLRDNFANPAIMKHLQGMAAAFGQFSAGQLTLVGRAIADIALGVFHLGKDVAGSGANFSSFGIWLNNIGTGFLGWSKSSKARADVQGFLGTLHRNGPVVVSILRSLGKVLPGILAGASATGTLELQAISGFLGLIAKLPKGWQQPLTEAAGALLILSKTGVISTGFKLRGLGKGKTGLWGKILPGVGLIGGALTAVVIVETLFPKGPGKGQPAGANPWATKAPPGVSGWNSWAQFGRNIEHWWDMVWQNTVGRTRRGVHDVAAIFDSFRHRGAIIFGAIRHDVAAKWDAMWGWVVARAHDRIGAVVTAFDGFRHRAAVIFDGIRHEIAHVWDQIWSNTAGRLIRFVAADQRLMNTFRHNIASTFDTIRHAIATAWDATWNATVGRVKRGVSDVTTWVGKLPGRIKGFFFGASHWLTTAGRETVLGLWDGMTVIWHKVTSWISGLAGWIKKHKGPVSFDRKLLVPAGKALMSGLHAGLLAGAGGPLGFISGLAGTIGGLISGGISGLFGGGGGGGGSWTGVILTALKMLGQSSSWLPVVMRRLMQESGGNATIVNTTDSNWLAGHPSVGGMQVIKGTFDAYAGPFRNVGPFEYGVSVNRLANMFAGLNYALHRYGSLAALSQPGGYALGTSSARRGWAWTGEHGPELAFFGGGETVLSASQSRRYRFSQPDPGDATLGDVIRELTRHRRQLAALTDVAAAQGREFGRVLNGASHTAARSARHSVSAD